MKVGRKDWLEWQKKVIYDEYVRGVEFKVENDRHDQPSLKEKKKFHVIDSNRGEVITTGRI